MIDTIKQAITSGMIMIGLAVPGLALLSFLIDVLKGAIRIAE